ncbi:MAG: diiron oxygenase [Acidobacteriota bacterium]
MILSLNEVKLGLWKTHERVDRTLAPKREDHSWIYGTSYWDALTPDQRIELLWLEHAHTISALIWFKEGLSPLYTRLIEKYGERISPEVREHMVAFCEEESSHTRMFRRYLRAASLPLYERPDLLGLIPAIERVHPIAGILCTYLVQGAIEEATVRQDADHLDPQTRLVLRKHHLAEARHLAFGKWLCESVLEESSHATKMRTGHLTRGYMGAAIRRFTYHPEISQYLSFDLGIDPNDAEEIERIRRSDNNRRLNDERYGPMLEWVRRMGIVKPAYDWLAVAAGILPLAHFSRWSQNGPFSAAGAARRAATIPAVPVMETP